MSSKDDPFNPAGKTIIRPNPGRKQKTVLARAMPTPAGAQPTPAEILGATVFDPGGQQAPPVSTSGTVIYQGPPLAQDGAMRAGSPSPGLPPRSSAETARKIQQDALINASDGVEYGAANPIITAAAPLLMLLGHLRLLSVERKAEPLAEHVAELIEEFDRKIAKANISEEDARIAKFVLCETADDIIGNLPGSDQDIWARHSMLLQFFQVKPTGSGFFEALNTVLADPEDHCDLVELMHVCLSLGFEGQYRGLAREDSGLERVRRDVYETLAYFRPRGDDEISPHWQGLSTTEARGSMRVPLWVIGAATAALLTAAFFTLRVFITDEGDALASKLLALNPTAPVTIERVSFVPLTEEVKATGPTISQIDRISAALAQDIANGGLTVGTKGDFIVVEINNVLLFQPGKADVKPEFEPIAARIASALDKERGPIKIVGHTDNVKPRKSSEFKSNFDLSVARANSVEKMIAPHFSDPSRTAVEGKGEDEPLTDNATPDGRAKNRRVDVMIPREETL